MKLFKLSGLVLTAAAISVAGPAAAQMSDGKMKSVKQTIPGHPIDEVYSGYYYLTPATKQLQDDDFENPAGAWLAEGEDAWSKVEGKAGKSCQTCHNVASASMKGVGATWPKYNAERKKIMSVEQRINLCRTKFMQAKPLKWKSNELLSMTIYVNNQSRGMPVNVKVDGPVKPFFEKGKAFYYQRRGQLDMACANCHETYAGERIRMNLLSQGQSNGFPVYRLKWQKPGSIHRRFVGCNKQVRAKPYKMGSDEYNNLELYVKWRGSGLTVETPAVRN